MDEFGLIAVIVKLNGRGASDATTRRVFLPGLLPSVKVVRALPMPSVMAFNADNFPLPVVTVNVTGTPENPTPALSCTSTITASVEPATPCTPETFTRVVGVRVSIRTTVPPV